MRYLRKGIAALFGVAAGCAVGVGAGIAYTVVDNFDRLDVMNAALEKYDEAYHAGPEILADVESKDPDVVWVGGLIGQIEMAAAGFALAGAVTGGLVAGRKRKEPAVGPGAGPQ